MTDDLTTLMERIEAVTGHRPRIAQISADYWRVECGAMWSAGASTPEQALTTILISLGDSGGSS